MAKTSERWRQWQEELPVSGRPADPHELWAAELPVSAAAALRAYANLPHVPEVVAPEPEPGPEELVSTEPFDPDPYGDEPGRFFLVEVADGETPVTRSFLTAEAMAARLATLEGRDVYVRMFYGLHLGLTVRGPGPRFLLLPDGAVTVPMQWPAEFPRRVPVEETAADLCDDGYLGPPELAVTVAAPVKATRRPPRRPPAAAGDGDEAEPTGPAK